jgi:DUF1009 family protein
VKNGVVLAVEAFEGTDECITRGGKLSGKDGGAIAIKVAKKNTICDLISLASVHNSSKLHQQQIFGACNRIKQNAYP